MSDRKAQPFDIVQKPQHYNNHPSGVEAIELCEVMTFNLGNTFKYTYRRGDKGNSLQDLNKALWYLNREEQRLARYTWLPAIFQSAFRVNAEFSEHHLDLTRQVLLGESDGDAYTVYEMLLNASDVREFMYRIQNARTALHALIARVSTPDAPQAS